MFTKLLRPITAVSKRIVHANSIQVSIRAFSQITYGASQAFINSPAPTFTCPAIVDNEVDSVNLENFKGKYVVLFFYPKDFTFVCPTEIIAFSDRAEEFEKLNTKLLACSCDTVESHLAWIKTPRKKGGLGSMKIPILGDNTKEIASKYGVLDTAKGIALRGLFLINPNGVLEQITVNNFSVGRNVDEVLRLVQATQFVAEHGEVCPANWKPGEKTIIPNQEQSTEFFASGSTESDEDKIKMEGNVVQIKTEKELKDLIQSGKKLVVDFYAPWCGKCKMIAPFFSKYSTEVTDVVFASVDTTDENLEKVAADMGIAHIPNFRFYHNGKEAGAEVTGYKKKLVQAQVEALVDMK